MAVVEFLYVLCVALLSLYGFNSLVLTWLYLRHRHDPVPAPSPPAEWPHVTVQLPIYLWRNSAATSCKGSSGCWPQRPGWTTHAAGWRSSFSTIRLTRPAGWRRGPSLVSGDRG